MADGNRKLMLNGIDILLLVKDHRISMQMGVCFFFCYIEANRFRFVENCHGTIQTSAALG